MSEREMTLQEWVERLPEIHAARREYDALRSRLTETEQERDVLQDSLAGSLGTTDKLAARLAEAEALANEVLTPWPSGRMADGSIIVSPTLVQKFRAFLAADSASHRENERG